MNQKNQKATEFVCTLKTTASPNLLAHHMQFLTRMKFARKRRETDQLGDPFDREGWRGLLQPPPATLQGVIGGVSFRNYDRGVGQDSERKSHVKSS